MAAGGSGQVFKANYCGQLVAVKELFSQLIDGADRDEFRSEASILATLHHPNIITFFGISSFSETLFLVTEWCPGSVEALFDQKAERQ
mgnify:CR=1 FL=1